MSRTPPRMVNLARRLIACDARGRKSSAPGKNATAPVIELLRPHLATLVGNGGFHALLSRALTLARKEAPWLRDLQVNADGSLQGLDELQTPPGPEELLKGRTIIVAQLVGLLMAFIGEDLTFRLLCEIWPKLRLDGLDGQANENEE